MTRTLSCGALVRSVAIDRRRLDHALEAVQHQQRLARQLARELGAERLDSLDARGRAQPEAARDLRDDSCGVAAAGERHEGDAPGEAVPHVARHARREPRLAGPARPGERDQPVLRTLQQLGERRALGLAADERGAGGRERAQVRRRPRRPRRGELLAQACELVRQLARREVPLGGQLAQAALDHPAQRRGHAGRVERPRRVAQDRGDRLGRRAVLERAPAARHLVEHGAERELVGAVVEREPLRLLGGHVGHGSHDDTLSGQRPDVGRVVGAPVAQPRLDAREAEVQDLHEPLARDHHVLGLQVAVHDALRVRGRQRGRQLRRDLDQPLGGERGPSDQRAHALAVHELHDDVVVRRL